MANLPQFVRSKDPISIPIVKIMANSTALPIVKAGHAAIYLPKLFFTEIFFIPNPKKIKVEKRNVFLVLRANADENLMTNKVAKCLRQLCSH